MIEVAFRVIEHVEEQWNGDDKRNCRRTSHLYCPRTKAGPAPLYQRVDGEHLDPVPLIETLNEIGGRNGCGRVDLVENRLVGMKSRGVYETPGGTILLAAHRGIESITVDGGAMHLKDELMPRYASLIYNGFWFAPEREMLQAAIDKSQEHVTGRVTMKLYKGNATVIGRESEHSLYDQDLVTFEEGTGDYDQRDAAGFIRLHALRLRTLGQRERRLKP